MPNKWYVRGSSVERAAVNAHEKNGALLAGRFAGSKCKGKIKADVIALYPDRLVIEQYKKGKSSWKKDKDKFDKVKLPTEVLIVKKFIIQE